MSEIEFIELLEFVEFFGFVGFVGLVEIDRDLLRLLEIDWSLLGLLSLPRTFQVPRNDFLLRNSSTNISVV